MQVAMGFVSPENVGECIKLTGEFRWLPSCHPSKMDKLEVGMAYYESTGFCILCFTI